MSDLKAQIEIAADASGVEAGVAGAKRSVAGLGAAAKKAGEDASKGFGQFGAGGEEAGAKVDRATARMISSIQRTTAVMEAGSRESSKYFELLAQQRGLDVNALRPYLDQLDQTAAKQVHAGMTAKQMSNNLRGIPAQFTDIFTSLASGQQPLTVLLQQGGQLKDMFGGIGPAARELGKYVLGLVNPFSLAAAAAGVLGLAYFQGSKEASAFAKSIILSGNAAGTSVSQLAEMADRIDQVAGTEAQAAAALAQMAATGLVAGKNLEEFSATAVRMERAVGQAVEDTVKQFAELGKAPVEASLKLNEQYRYLTAAVYDQIKALEDQGRTSEAAAAAQAAYAQAMDDRTAQIEQSLGSLQRGWRAITSVAKEAWDAMLNVGRGQSLSERLADVDRDIAMAQARLVAARTGRAGISVEAEADKLKSLQAMREGLQADLRMDKALAEQQAERVRVEQAGIKWRQLSAEYAGKQVKLERELAQARELAKVAGVGEVELQKQLSAIRDKYADKLRARAGEGEGELAALRARIVAERQYLALLGEQGLEADKLNDGERRALKIQEELKGSLSAKARVQKELELSAANELAVILKSQAAIKDRAKAMAEVKAQHDKVVESAFKAADSIAGTADAQEKANATYGLGKSAVAELTLAQMQNNLAQLEATDNVIPGYTAALQEQIDQQKRLIAALKASEGLEASDKAAKEVAAQWQKAADAIDSVFRNTFADIFNGNGDWLKSLGQSLRTTVATALADAVYSATVKGAVNDFVGWLSGISSGGGGGGAGGMSSWLSAGKSLWDGFSASGFGGMFSNLGSGLNGLGNTIGWQGLADYGAGLYGGAGSATGGAMGAGSASAAWAGPAAAIALAAIANGKLYDAGWRLQRGDLPKGLLPVQMFTDTLLATPLLEKMFGGKTAAMLTGSSFTARLFGRKAKEVTQSGVEGTFGDAGFDGAQYADWQRKGGLFRSTKRGTDYSAINSELDQMLDAGLVSVRGSVSGYAEAIGLSADALTGYSKSIRLALTGDAATDAAAFTQLFTGIGDEMSLRIAPGLADLARSGESAVATFARLASTFELTNTIADVMGKDAAVAFGGVALASAEARQSMVDLAGGVEALAGKFTSYYTTYYSEAEQQARATELLTAQFSKLGFSLPGSRDAFRDLVEAQDLTTEAGRASYNALLDLAGAFASITDVADQAGLAWKAAGEDLRKYLDGLAVSDANPRGIADRFGAAQGDYSKYLALVQGGNADYADELQSASDILLSLGREMYASSASYASLFDKVVGELGGVADKAAVGGYAPPDTSAAVVQTAAAVQQSNGLLQQQLTVQQKTIETLNAQIRQQTAIAEQTAKKLDALTQAVERSGRLQRQAIEENLA